MVLRGERLRESGRAPVVSLRRDAPLATAWLLLVATCAAIVAWLIFKADDTALGHANRPPPLVVAELPPAPPKPEAVAAPAAPEPSAPVAPPTQDAPPAPAPATAAPASPAGTAEPAPAMAAAPDAPAATEHEVEDPDHTPLIPAPDPALVEQTPAGSLPKIGADGRQPWRVYSRPFDAPEKQPRITIVLTGLGLSHGDTQAALAKLPGGVTFSFDPYADQLDQWVAASRGRGHEVLLDLPLEPVNYPQSDPGPQTLTLGATAADNQARLDWVLARTSGYVGVAAAYGAAFSGAVNAMLPVLQTLHNRGLVYVDNHIAGQALPTRLARDIGVPLVVNDRYIDAEGTRGALDVRLAELERLARSAGHAVGFAAPHPATIDRLTEWLPQIEAKKILLAPVSAMVPK